MAYTMVSAITAAMQRVGTFPPIDTVEFRLELQHQVREVLFTEKGTFSWRRFELGRRLFDCLGEAQGWRCCYCGVRTNEHYRDEYVATLEHVIPTGQGGPDHPDNLVMACWKCNTERGHEASPSRLARAAPQPRRGVPNVRYFKDMRVT